MSGSAGSLSGSGLIYDSGITIRRWSMFIAGPDGAPSCRRYADTADRTKLRCESGAGFSPKLLRA